MIKPAESVAAITISGRTIHCRTAEDRSLLSDAEVIADDADLAKSISIGRLMLIKDSCQLYSLGSQQRLIKMAIDRLNS